MATVTRASGACAVEPAIGKKLRAIRAWKVAIGLSRVGLLAATVLIVGMLTAMLADWLTLPDNMALHPWLTRVALATASAVFIVGSWRMVSRHRWLSGAAADVDAANPALEHRWSTLTNVVEHEATENPHPAMVRQLAREAIAWAPRVRPGHVVSMRHLAFAGVACALAIIAMLAPAFWDHERTLVLAARFWSPYADITLTRFDALPEEVIVAEGEAVTLEARLLGRVPAQAVLRLLSGSGKERRFELAVDPRSDGLVAHRVYDVDKPFSFRWEAGDARTDWLPAVVVRRPKIAALRFVVTPPEYTKQPTIQRRNCLRRCASSRVAPWSWPCARTNPSRSCN